MAALPEEFRNQIEEGSKFAPEAGRYHLYVSYSCPFASRSLAVMYLKGLEDVIGLSVVHPTYQRTKPDDPNDTHVGWTFANPDDAPFSSVNGYGSFKVDGLIPDTVNSAKYIRDLYEKSGGTSGKYSVPVLWDKKLGVIVSNNSGDLMQTFNSQFNNLAKNPDLDLFPEDLKDKMDAVSAWVVPNIFLGVYGCGFARDQQKYEAAVSNLFSSLDRVEDILSQQRYLTGDTLTGADITLFKCLIRFDEVYFLLFKANKKFIHQCPNIREYVKELYQIPEIKKSVNMEHIKVGYYSSFGQPELNYYGIIPVGPGPWYKEPHDREEKFPVKK